VILVYWEKVQSIRSEQLTNKGKTTMAQQNQVKVSPFDYVARKSTYIRLTLVNMIARYELHEFMRVCRTMYDEITRQRKVIDQKDQEIARLNRVILANEKTYRLNLVKALRVIDLPKVRKIERTANGDIITYVQ
jgi:hypothetical protein